MVPAQRWGKQVAQNNKEDLFICHDMCLYGFWTFPASSWMVYVIKNSIRWNWNTTDTILHIPNLPDGS